MLPELGRTEEHRTSTKHQKIRNFPGKESASQCRGPALDPWSGKIPHASEQLCPRAATIEPRSSEPRAKELKLLSLRATATEARTL